MHKQRKKPCIRWHNIHSIIHFCRNWNGLVRGNKSGKRVTKLFMFQTKNWNGKKAGNKFKFQLGKKVNAYRLRIPKH